MDISLEQLIDYSQFLDHEDVDFIEFLHSYDQNHLFDIMYIMDDIEWKKENDEDYLPLEVLHKFMESNDIEECYISE